MRDGAVKQDMCRIFTWLSSWRNVRLQHPDFFKEKNEQNFMLAVFCLVCDNSHLGKSLIT